MRRTKIGIAALSAALLLQGCAATPMGPTVQVMPAPNKPFQLFQEDQALCKQFATNEVSGQAQAANEKAIGAAVLGTVLGAGLGAAVGNGRGAAIGAAGGSVIGTGLGADTSQNAQMGIQEQYNNAYSQCMYSKGNQVQGFMPWVVAPPPPPPPVAPPPPAPKKPKPVAVKKPAATGTVPPPPTGAVAHH